MAIPGNDPSLNGIGSELNAIGFPEFTSKLINDTFDALIGANLRQMESYRELVKDVGATLTDFIKNTSDDVSDEEIVRLLTGIVGEQVEIKQGTTLEKAKLDAISAAVKIPELASVSSTGTAASPQSPSVKKPAEELIHSDNTLLIKTAKVGSEKDAKEGATLDEVAINALYTAAAKRIAANRYDLLKDMVKMGLLRLVVDNGEILTRLDFRAEKKTVVNTKTSTRTDRTTTGNLKGSFVGTMFGISGNVKSTGISVKTYDRNKNEDNTTTANIMGQVRINFHTDYMPLKA